MDRYHSFANNEPKRLSLNHLLPRVLLRFALGYVLVALAGRTRIIGIEVNPRSRTLTCPTVQVESWEGFSFEEICLRHLPHIKQGLGISGIATESSVWRFIPQKGDERNGAQVDLVIKRVDKIVHLVEMKFSESPYTISKEYEEKLKARRNLFMEMAGVKRGVVITFVTPAGVSQGIHSSIVHSQLTAKHLFTDVM